MRALQVLSGWVYCGVSIDYAPGWLACAGLIALVVDSLLWAEDVL